MSSYTTVDNVAGMFPTFIRPPALGTVQKPSDELIQTFIDDVASDLDAIMQRRFNEAILSAGDFPTWTSQLSQDALQVLEKINRYGAAEQLGQTLAGFGTMMASDLAKQYGEAYDELRGQLDARQAATAGGGTMGKPLPSGMYDHLFDPLSRTETPRPGLTAIAGGDQPTDQTPADTGSSAAFGRFDKRGT